MHAPVRCERETELPIELGAQRIKFEVDLGSSTRAPPAAGRFCLTALVRWRDRSGGGAGSVADSATGGRAGPAAALVQWCGREEQPRRWETERTRKEEGAAARAATAPLAAWRSRWLHVRRAWPAAAARRAGAARGAPPRLKIEGLQF